MATAKRSEIEFQIIKKEYVKLLKTFLNPEGHHNRITSSKVIAVFLDGGSLPIGGVSSGRVSACSLRSRLVFFSFFSYILY